MSDEDEPILEIDCACDAPRCKRKFQVYADGTLAVVNGGGRKFTISVTPNIAAGLAAFFEVPFTSPPCPYCGVTLYEDDDKVWACLNDNCTGKTPA